MTRAAAGTATRWWSKIANFNGRSSLFGASENARLTERFTRIGPDQIEYLFTVEDPAVWTRPWTGRMTISKDDSQYELVEYACHEGNYAMVNSLSGARAALEAEGGAAVAAGQVIIPGTQDGRQT